MYPTNRSRIPKKLLCCLSKNDPLAGHGYITTFSIFKIYL